MKTELGPPPHLPLPPLLRHLAGSVLLVLGILVSDVPTMLASTRWPTVQGSILRCRLVATSVRGWDGEVYHSERNAVITYEYSVNSISYSSADVNAIRSHFHHYPASYASRYPVGLDVTVYYNPKDPSQAVLEPGFIDVFKAFDIYSYILFVAGLYFISLGISGTRPNSVPKSKSLPSHQEPGAA